MTLAETLRRNRLVRSRVEAIREPADGESVESVARTQAKASGAGSEPGLRDWIGVLAMVTGLVMARSTLTLAPKTRSGRSER